MNRFTNQFPQSLEKKVCTIFAKVAFGASGAPTLSAVNSKGVLSVTRNGAGDFTFVFGTAANGVGAKDTYVKLLCVRQVYNSGSSAPAAPAVYIKADNVATASLRIVTNAAGVATDPASGEIGYFEFVMGDSTAP